MHNHMTQKDNDHLGGGFPEHIFTKRVKFAHFSHRKAVGGGVHVKVRPIDPLWGGNIVTNPNKQR